MSQICIFDNEKHQFCTLCPCIFHFCTFRRRSRSFHDVKWPIWQLHGWTTWAYDDKCSILSSFLWGAGSNFIPGKSKHILQVKWLQKREVTLSSDFLAFVGSTSSLLKFSTRLSKGSRINLANLRNLEIVENLFKTFLRQSIEHRSTTETTQISRDEVHDISIPSQLFVTLRKVMGSARVQTPGIISLAHHRKKKRKPYLFIFQG